MKYFIIIILFMVSCQEDFELAPESSLVIEAYIFENKQVKNIKLSFVDPIGSQSGLINISDAEVFISWNDFYYKLVDRNNSGLFSDENNNLKIIGGNTYELLIRYNNEEYRAVTTVPASPIQLKASKDTLNIDSPTDLIKATWQNSDSLWYLGVIVSDSPVETDFPFNNFFSIPTQDSELEITPNDVQNTGNKQFILFGITEDYEELYRISKSTIGSSYAGNVSNGFGIFAAFSSDTVNFVVVNK